MKFKIPVKPLSINRAFKGRRFKTPEYQEYEEEIFYLLPHRDRPIHDGELSVSYTFFLKNYSITDTGNLEKLLTDILVKAEYIKDDRYIKELRCIKEKSAEDRIEVEILPYTKATPRI